MKILLVSTVPYGETIVGNGYIYTNTIDSLVRRGLGFKAAAIEVHYSNAESSKSICPIIMHSLERNPLNKLLTSAAAFGVISPETIKISSVIHCIAKSFDSVVWFGSAYDPLTVAFSRLNIPNFIFHVNDSIALYERSYFKSSWLRRLIASAHEKRLIQSLFSRIVYVSRDDYNFASKHNGGAKLILLPIGVKMESTIMCTRGSKNFAVIFSGNMSYRPNVDAALYLIQEVAPLMPNIEFRIVGDSPDIKILAAARASGNIIITGRVSSVITELVKAGVMIVPIFDASGIKIKILEAMAVGLPVITTSHCVQSFPVTPPVLIANTPEEFANSIQALARDEMLWMLMHNKTRDFVRHYFSWDARTDKLLALGGQ
jgi:glycosyltransferase involved in cell wall biosynthesis